MWEGENPPDGNVILSHLILANELHEAEPEMLMKTVAYVMPKGYLIKAEPFNELNEEGLINTIVAWTSYNETVQDLTGKDIEVVMQVPHIQWHVAIDKKASRIKQKVTENKAVSSLQRAYNSSATPTKPMKLG